MRHISPVKPSTNQPPTEAKREAALFERLRREGETLTWQATVEDPDVLLKPWVMNRRVLKLNPNPQAVLEETLPCSERDLSHLVTKEHH